MGPEWEILLHSPQAEACRSNMPIVIPKESYDTIIRLLVKILARWFDEDLRDVESTYLVEISFGSRNANLLATCQENVIHIDFKYDKA